MFHKFLKNVQLKSKKPLNPIEGKWGFYSFLLTRLFLIGHIPIYIGIKFNFVLCELDVRRILSPHKHLLKLSCHPFLFATNSSNYFGQPPFINVLDRGLAIAKQPSISIKGQLLLQCPVGGRCYFYGSLPSQDFVHLESTTEIKESLQPDFAIIRAS